MKRQNQPQIKIRCTQINAHTRAFFSQLTTRNSQLSVPHLRPSDFHLWLILFLSLAISLAAAPSTQPSLSSTSTIDEILDALDARGKTLEDFSAKVQLTDTDPDSGESTINTGTVLLQRLGPDDARIRIGFTRQQVGNKIFTVNHVYTLDKGTLDERDYIKQTETARQVFKPGEKVDLFKLGEGPFPLPIGQKKEDVHQSFDVQKIPADPTDPPNTVHLKLTPKDHTPLAKNFKTIDVWVDTTTVMPRRIQTEDITQSSQRTTDLTDVKINTGAADKDFSQPPVSAKWDVVEEPGGQ